MQSRRSGPCWGGRGARRSVRPALLSPTPCRAGFERSFSGPAGEGGKPALTNELNARVNSSQDIAGAIRASLIDLLPDELDIAARTRGISNPHRTPCLFQNASI